MCVQSRIRLLIIIILLHSYCCENSLITYTQRAHITLYYTSTSCLEWWMANSRFRNYSFVRNLPAFSQFTTTAWPPIPSRVCKMPTEYTHAISLTHTHTHSAYTLPTVAWIFLVSPYGESVQCIECIAFVFIVPQTCYNNDNNNNIRVSRHKFACCAPMFCSFHI